MENELVRSFELSPSKNTNNDGDRPRFRRFLSNMNRYFQNVTKTRILQGFQHWKVQEVEEFHKSMNRNYMDDDELERLTHTIRMAGIVSLDMSSPLPIMDDCDTLYRAISRMVPNLQQLDLSHTTNSSSILESFADRCPRLEKITWNKKIRWNNIGHHTINADGKDLQPMDNLKELYLDNWSFGFDHENLIYRDEDTDDDGDADGDDDNGVTEIEAMSDSNNYPNVFLFHKLNSNTMERLSIRNARYMNFDESLSYEIPQQVLMKFVRKAPATLVWFRSDLSPANIQILQSERPGIQLLN